MLVVGLKAEYTKKATNTTTFTCAQGEDIFRAAEKAIETGEGVPVEIVTIGRNEAGEEVSRFYVTWSFKSKS